MKILILTFIVAANICFAQEAEKDSLNAQRKTVGFDKIQHTAVSCLLTLSSQYIMVNKGGIDEGKALPYSISSSAWIGLTKELNDWQTKEIPFDWGDMIANSIGIAIAVFIITH